MAEHIETLNVPYTPSQMFSLVSDISAYPSFIKWIKALRVSKPRQDGHTHHCIGEAVVGFKGFTERFATAVTSNRFDNTVQVRLVRGPFRKLENDWRFEPIMTDGAKITFRIDYEFNNFVLRALADANKHTAINRIIDAFLTEAERRYGPSTEAPDLSSD